MIFVNRKNIKIPPALRSTKAVHAHRSILAHLEEYKDHLEQVRFRFNSDIWEEVQPDLINLFHNKCAYCESIIISGEGVVEHFRPKAGAESLNGKRQQPYYAWLAYEWQNLLWACRSCIRPRGPTKRTLGKGNRFPVSNQRAPIGTKISECRALEKPLLIDPCFDQPEKHIEFLASGICRALSRRGHITIEIIDLNRPNLVSQREVAWSHTGNLIERLIHSLEAPNSAATATAKQKVIEQIGGAMPYTAVSRSALQVAVSRFGPLSKSPIAQTLASLIDQYGGRSNLARSEAFSEITVESIEQEFQPSFQISSSAQRDTNDFLRSAQEHINRIEIRNFKAIEELDIDIPNGTKNSASALALLGENATAKTTVLEAVALALAGVEVAQRMRPDARELIRSGIKNRAHHPAEIRLFTTEGAKPIHLMIDQYGRFTGSISPSMVTIGYSPQRFFINGKNIRQKKEPIQVSSLFKIKQQMAAPNIWLTQCSQERFNAAVRAIRPLLLLPQEGKVNRYWAPRNNGHLAFEFSDRTESLDRFSEGYRSVVAMTVDIINVMLNYWRDLETAHGVVLIDEIETHLHPRWKKRLVRGLRDAMPYVQFIITTHDPLCLRGFRDREVVVLRRDANRIEQVPDLPNVQGLSIEQLLTSDFFGLASTEDQDTEAMFHRLVMLATKTERSPDEEAELKKQREGVRDTLRLGKTPLTCVFYEAIDKYLVERSQASPQNRPKLDQETVDSLVRQWHRLDQAKGTK